MTEPEPPAEYLDAAEVGILLDGLADPSVEVRVAMFEQSQTVTTPLPRTRTS